jgi:hypothetical protein
LRPVAGLDPASHIDDIAPAEEAENAEESPQEPPMNATAKPQGRINWLNVSTVLSAVILIGAEVFGAAFAGGWAFATLFNIELGGYGVLLLQGIFFLLGVVVMVRFVAHARRIEPFTKG